MNIDVQQTECIESKICFDDGNIVERRRPVTGRLWCFVC